MSTWYSKRMGKRKWFLEQSQTELGFVAATSIWSKVWIVSLTTEHQGNFFEIQFWKPFVFYKGAEVGWSSDIYLSETSSIIYPPPTQKIGFQFEKSARNSCDHFFVGIFVPQNLSLFQYKHRKNCHQNMSSKLSSKNGTNILEQFGDSLGQFGDILGQFWDILGQFGDI